MSLAQAIDRIRPVVVQIGFMAAGRDLMEKIRRPFVRVPLGTGFFVNSEGYVVTTNHVIQEGVRLTNRMRAERVGIEVGLAQANTENMRGNFAVVDFDIVAEDNRHDLALLKLKRNPFMGEVRSGIVIGDKELPLLHGVGSLDPNRPKEGVPIGVSGYPLGLPVLVTNGGFVASSWHFGIEEVSVPNAPDWFRMPDIADSYLMDAEVNGGNSGGPVYLEENAAIIGMCQATLQAYVTDKSGDAVSVSGGPIFHSSGLTVVVPVKYVIELLEKQHLNWERVKS